MNSKEKIKYAALLRGIYPMNPNMRNEKLIGAFETLGFKNVTSVISSGNILFETSSQDASTLESKIEKALPKLLGFTSTTIIRSRDELLMLVDKNPFNGIEDTPNSRLNVTFLKKPQDVKLKFPYRYENNSFELPGIYNREICSVINITNSKTPDLMSWLEKQFGKEITTRTWKTVQRILKKMEK